MKCKNEKARMKIISSLLVMGLLFSSTGFLLSTGETVSAERQDFPQIKMLCDHYHYTTADPWGKWFEDNYPGELTVSYLTGPLTYEELINYDIFITYLSWRPDLGPRPTASEVEALEQYVRDGGGVMLMGDDDYWGLWTNEYCNILSEPFNVYYNDDQLLDPTNYDITVTRPEDDYERHIVFHNMAEHPTTVGVTNVWVHGTCSLVVNNPNAVVVVAGDDDTYSDRYPGYPQGSYPPAIVALEHGSGRILFAGDYSAFKHDVYDNRTFIWNILLWLAETRADLTLSSDDITFSNPNPTVGETVRITAIIQNIGNVDAGTFEVGFYDGDPFKEGFLIGSQTIYSIKAGETQIVQMDWKWTVNPGNYDIHVMADSNNLIIEKDEKNNIKFRPIEVSCKYDNSNEIHTPQSKKALIIVPYHHQGFVGYSEELKSRLEKIGFQADYIKDRDVSITKLDELLDENYGVIHITSHGTETEIAIEYFYNENERAERWDELKQEYREYGTNFENMFIWRKEDEKGKKSYIGIKGDFIRARCSELSKHPLVFFESCDMGKNSDMIDAFLCKGAGAYVGFDDKVMIDPYLGGWVYRTVGEVSKEFYHYLIDYGYTVKKAVDNTEPGDHPDCHIPKTCRNVNLVSYGKDKYLVLIESLY